MGKNQIVLLCYCEKLSDSGIWIDMVIVLLDIKWNFLAKKFYT